MLRLTSREYEKSNPDRIEKFFLKQEDHLNDDHFLDSSLILNRHLCLKIAIDVIDDKGKMKTGVIAKWQKQLSKSYSLAPGQKYDAPRKKWLLFALSHFDEKWLNSFHLPIANHFALDVIRLSLLYTKKKTLIDADVKRAALSAYLTDLRQTLGSCFATAPALFIRKTKPEMFFKDLHELLHKAHLQRVIEGDQYIIPIATHIEEAAGQFPFFVFHFLPKKVMTFLCELFLNFQVFQGGYLAQFFQIKKLVSIWREEKKVHVTTFHQLLKQLFELKVGHAIEKPDQLPALSTPLQIQVPKDAADESYALFEQIYYHFCSYQSHPLLKVWEYTIASMSDVKLDFNYWNSCAALGFNSEEKGSVANCLMTNAEEKIQKLQKLIEEIGVQIEQVDLYLQSLNVRARTASFETMQHIKGRAASEQARLSRLVAERDAYHARSQNLADKLAEIARGIGNHFTKAFQEIYDPKIIKKNEDLYSDSPAGFRLVYKHQRQDPALWTNITSSAQYVQFLSHFFHLLVTDLEEEISMHAKDLGDLMHALSSFVSTEEFLLNAKLRCAKRGGFSKIEETFMPWAYVSGGTMSQLVALYFSSSTRPSEIRKVPKKESEFVDFLLEFILDAPFNLLEDLKKGKESSFLMHSPTHAFTFEPSNPSFVTGIKSGKYPFSWIRDEMVNVAVTRLKGVKLDGFQQSAFYSKFVSLLPLPLFSLLRGKIDILPGSGSLDKLKKGAMDHVPNNIPKALKESFEDHLDYCLFSLLPLFSGSVAANVMKEVFAILQKPDAPCLHESAKKMQEMSQVEVISKLELIDLIKSLWIIENKAPSFSEDISFAISKAFEELAVCYQSPFIFADSNWIREKFAFCVNPATLQLQLYRVDYTGQEGIPMRSWKKFLGVENQNTWAIFDHPHEYGL